MADHKKQPLLVVFGGLSGTGKTTLAKATAEELAATYLRVDVIEQALRASGSLAGEVGVGLTIAAKPRLGLPAPNFRETF